MSGKGFVLRCDVSGEANTSRRSFRWTAREVAMALLRTADAVRSNLSGAIEGCGITLQQYNVLRILRGAHHDPLPTLEIGKQMIERQPGITRLLDRLEAKELVRRERCRADRRRMHAWITADGLDLLEGLDAPIDDAVEAALASLSDQERETLIRLLRRIGRQNQVKPT